MPSAKASKSNKAVPTATGDANKNPKKATISKNLPKPQPESPHHHQSRSLPTKTGNITKITHKATTMMMMMMMMTNSTRMPLRENS